MPGQPDIKESLAVGIGSTIALTTRQTNRHRHPSRRPAHESHNSSWRPADLAHPAPTEGA